MGENILVAELLLELVFSIDVHANESLLLQKTLPVYARKLNCFYIAIYKPDTENRLIALKSIPLQYQRMEHWNLVEQRIDEFYHTKQSFQEFQLGSNHFYMYEMPAYGMMILGRHQAFELKLKNEFKSIIKHKTKILLNNQNHFALIEAEKVIRSKAEELEKKENNIRQILEASQDAILVFNSSGTVSDYNSSAEKEFQIIKEKGLHIKNLFVIENFSNCDELLHEIFENKKDQSKPQQFEAKGLGIFSNQFFNIRFSLIDQEGETVSIAFISNITQQKRIESLKEAELQIEKTINYFSQSIFDFSTIEELLWGVVNNCISYLEFEDCVIYVKDDQNPDQLKQMAAYGLKNMGSNQIFNPIYIQKGQGIVGTVALTAQPEIIYDTSKDNRYIVDDMRRLSELTVPIVLHGEVIGIIDTEHSQKGYFNEIHLRILTSVSKLIANRIDKLKEQEEKERLQDNVFQINKNLGEKVQELELANEAVAALSTFARENPNSVLRFSKSMQLLFANDASKIEFLDLFGIDEEGIRDEEFNNFYINFVRSNEVYKTLFLERGGLTFSVTLKNVKETDYVNVYANNLTSFINQIKEKELELFQLNQKLDEQKVFYEFILDNLPADLAVFDSQHRYLYVNPAGIKDPELRAFLIGKDDFDYCHYRNKPTELAEKRREIFQKILKNKKAEQWEDEQMDSKGNRQVVFRNMSPLFDQEGNIKYIVGYGININERKFAEEKLVKVNERLQLLESFLRLTGDAIQVADESGRMVYINRTASERLSIPESKVENYHVSDFEPLFNDHRNWKNHLAELQKTGLFRIESENKNTNTGQITFVDVNAKYEVINNHGYVIAISRDITERKATERELLETKQKLESILNEMGDVLWSTSLYDNQIFYYTPSVEKLFEIPLEEWYKDRSLWVKVIHPEDKEIVEEVEFQLNSKGNYDVDYRIITHSGKIKWINNKGKIVFNEDQLPVRIDGFITDITKVKLSFERQKQFIKEAPTAIAMLDRDMKYIAVSDKFISDYHLEPISLIGQSHFEVFPYITEEWRQIYQDCLEGTSFSREEDKFVEADGSTIWLKWKINPWFNDNAEIGGIIILTEDITKIKESKEEELKHILKLTQTQNDRLKNFAHIVSHNLRSHSGNIQSLIDLLVEEMPDLKDFELTQLMQQASSNLIETISHLSEVAAMNVKENQQMHLVDLFQTTEKAINNVSALAKNSNVQLINELKGNEKIMGIPAYLDSILLNFLTNGIKYRSKEKKSYVKVKSEEHLNMLIIEIEDNGLGIDMKRHGNKLFGMYKTFHGNSDARGIGLFITKNQIEAMGGRIEVESVLGEGTTFRIIFTFDYSLDYTTENS